MTELAIAPTYAAAPAAQAFPVWPDAWYVVAQSKQISRAPLGVNLWGRHLVCYRRANGQAVVMDARCWHLGADLTKGTVQGEQIVCPLHGWRYGPSGQCEGIPAQAEIPPCAKLQSYATAECAGKVFAFPATIASYPLPFFTATAPDDLVTAAPFEFVARSPWWLLSANGFDIQHFAIAHDRRLVQPPKITAPHPAARRIVATFEVCGKTWRDRLTRKFAGRRVTMDTTVWSGTLALVNAHFHDKDHLDEAPPRTTSFGLTEILPLSSAPTSQSLVRVTISRRRRPGWWLLDQLDVRLKRHFIRVFLQPDMRLLHDLHYDPDHLIYADRQLVTYLQGLVTATRSNPKHKEPR